MKRVAALIALFGAVYFMVGFSCGSSYPPPTEGGGFYVETQLNGAFASDVTFGGQWQSDAQGAQGSTFSIPNYTKTDLVGSYESLSGRAPAIWSFGEYSGPCDGLQKSGLVPLQQAAILECVAVSGEESELSTTNFTISPSTLYSSNPPSIVTITGSGFTTTYGMPRVQYYYNNGTYVGEMSATQASSTAISAPPPSGFSSDPSGVYIGEVQNATSGGTWEILGVVDLDLVTPTQPNIGSAVWVGSGTSGWSGGGCYVPTTIHMSAAQQSSNPDQWAVTVSGTPYPPGTSWSWTITDAQGTLLSGSGSGSVDQGTYTASRTPIQVPYASFSGTLNYPGCSTTVVFNSGFTLVSQ